MMMDILLRYKRTIFVSILYFILLPLIPLFSIINTDPTQWTFGILGTAIGLLFTGAFIGALGFWVTFNVYRWEKMRDC